MICGITSQYSDKLIPTKSHDRCLHFDFALGTLVPWVALGCPSQVVPVTKSRFSDDAGTARRRGHVQGAAASETGSRCRMGTVQREANAGQREERSWRSRTSASAMGERQERVDRNL